MHVLKIWAKKIQKVIGRCDGRSRLAVLFLIGAFVGAVMKYNAEAYVTIGYEDYKIEENKQGFDYREMTASIIEKRNMESAQGLGNGGSVAGACGI